MGKMRIKKGTSGRPERRQGVITLSPKQRKRIKAKEANVYVKSTFNNTIVSFTDKNGDVLLAASAGSVGFRGTKKSTPYAASVVASNIARPLFEAGIKRVNAYVSGIGMGRESAIRAVSAAGIEVEMIKDLTPVPHNGCRPKKARRP